jgi:hypothetical protein
MIKSQVQRRWTSLTNRFNLPWWIEIKTTLPSCIYFFGPFDNFKEAKGLQDGYIEDLVAEKAFGITVEIKQCQPDLLTVFEESDLQKSSNHIDIYNKSTSELKKSTLNFCDVSYALKK